MPKVFFKTFGCRTNIVDTQIMNSSLANLQATDNEKSADIIVINSCTVTNGADSGVRQYVSKIRTNMPNVRLLFTGCGVDSLGKTLFSEGKIDAIFSASEKQNIENFAISDEKISQIGNKDFVDDAIITESFGKTRAFIKIQEGCDFECSYCIIPSVRGKSRSLSEDSIIRQIETLAMVGFSEFTLTGTNVGSYRNLSKLIYKISQIIGVKRIRLGSIEPCQLSDELLEIASEDFFAKHFHVALQHTNEKILNTMKRNNNFEEDEALLRKLADKGFSIGTDFIVGFPGESDEIWQDAILKVKNLPLTHIHPFIFSPRDGTVAQKLKDTPKGDISRARLKELSDIVAHKNYAFRQTKKDLIVLVEENGAGFDQFYNKCKLENATPKSWVKVANYEINENFNTALEYKECKN